MNLSAAVDAAIQQANADAAPFVPSHAQVATRLQPVVNAVLALGKPAAVDLFRQGVRIGSWDTHVVAECKAAWSLEPAPTPRWRQLS